LPGIRFPQLSRKKGPNHLPHFIFIFIFLEMFRGSQFIYLFVLIRKCFNNFIREEEEILALGLADPYPEVRSVWTLASSSF
jgi:hypothetical protein